MSCCNHTWTAQLIRSIKPVYQPPWPQAPRLRELIGVVREAEIVATRVDVQGAAHEGRCHGAALDVPAGAAGAPGGVPGRLPGLARLQVRDGCTGATE